MQTPRFDADFCNGFSGTLSAAGATKPDRKKTAGFSDTLSAAGTRNGACEPQRPDTWPAYGDRREEPIDDTRADCSEFRCSTGVKPIAAVRFPDATGLRRHRMSRKLRPVTQSTAVPHV